MDTKNTCPICGQLAHKSCSACHNIFYCSVEHQKSDWKVHKKSCRLFEVKYNEKLGRYVIATRDIPPGTIIMNEPALMIGPKQDTLPICLGCNKSLHEEDKKYYCSKCLIFPMCGAECEKIPIHANNECKIFCKQKSQFKSIKNFEETHLAYECIMVLRCLQLKESDPKAWLKLTNMTHLNEIRKAVFPNLWHRNQMNTVNILNDIYGLKQFSEMDIHTVLGYYYINSFQVRINKLETSGLFDNTYIMSHDCRPNTHHTFSDDFRMIVRSTMTIKKDELITTTYANTLDGTFDRRKDLRELKFFDCSCERCSDPTEFGTFFSSIKCFNCPSGYLLPVSSLCNYSDWNCSDCEFQASSDEIYKLTSKLKDEINSLQKKNSIQDLEKFLKQYKGIVLHPNHYLIIDVERKLLTMYGRTKGWLIHDLSLEALERKEALCRHVLSVMDVNEPGYSRVRGITLYELHAALYFMSNKKHEKKKISATDLKERLTEVLVILEEAGIIMSFDSVSTLEGSIAKSIPGSMAFIKESIAKH